MITGGTSLPSTAILSGMTILGNVSGTNIRPTKKAAPMMMLIRNTHLYPKLRFSPMASPTTPPIDGPVLAEKTNSAIGWEAISEFPNRSPMVPATLDRAVEPQSPMINMKMASIGMFLGYAQPEMLVKLRQTQTYQS
ncbi:hypothetical protein OGATHE_002959 [Ogataea polymorpha]|uniref:Uncharacterized protein n=1 Tax=Ogataea polymorpha TaxID=460523 RepID=A0A9P8T9L6_9ASCO|nr:hypothetical protein OGATHE_002959 [Ogataea polymorpha]